MYPNPVNDKLCFDNPNQFEINKVKLYTISGQLLSTFSTVGEFIELDAVETGVYFIKVYSGNSAFTSKVLKK
ncbi:T9SS type A sorting domain-containing protein [Psychroflexus sp. ALD_RP9]|uniref:T9SS type A sorting domain-containing protein n=1 Tax=Psychroflexus sp. ALD_RP9 TaxID=2777186 RepID=UPI001A8C8132|nr:T9SS type A sorting domain-containing protein [Psychroflexus sp. ALD_RP9]QSS97436.1 T9SS type A sorting domain-containing protein [Psychroflexus sp. ALD_RP9]